jgi:hypothetical protein
MQTKGEVKTGKQRHGCLTAWLVFSIVGYLSLIFIPNNFFPVPPGWYFPMLIVINLTYLVCAIALYQWKKWGFWVYCGSSVVGAVVNILAGFENGPSLIGLIFPLLLFGVLHIGKENKGWSQLE